MIENIFPFDDLRSLARRKSQSAITKSVHAKLVDDEVASGWIVDKRRKASVRLKKDKTHSAMLEDRVWTLFHKMRFTHLSGDRGSFLQTEPKTNPAIKSQVDVIAIDDDVAIAVECKSAAQFTKRTSFQEDIGRLVNIREKFARSVTSLLGHGHKRQTVLAFFLSNIEINDRDKERAKGSSILIFDDKDLEYYEKLVAHLGPAAKYQFLADALPGKTIPGLQIRVPAVKSRMGKFNCYTFPISPEYLLKIAYVSHRAKGAASDVETYQRMISKSRLSKIRTYITEDGIFPTNIVVNLDKRRLQFEKIRQATDKAEQDESGILGWLDIRPAYKSAWIIDGQHRLFAYSGHPRASSSHLAVLAFEGIPASAQARLFIDINAKQKSVKQSLLQELFSELHWDAEKPAVRIQAIISKAIQVLDRDRQSPLFGRIQTADAGRDSKCCISLASLFGAMERGGFHILRERKDGLIDYGPLWAVTNDRTLRRTTDVLSGWLTYAASSVPDWWDLGSAPGGGLSMNDGVTSLVNVLRSVLDHLATKNRKLLDLDSEDLVASLAPFGKALGGYLASMSEEDRKRFRDLRGSQGQTTRTRRFQAAIRDQIPTFQPEGLDEFMRLEKEQTNLRAKQIVDRIENLLKQHVLDTLKVEFGDEETGWWLLGVPKTVRVEVGQRYEADDGKRGSKDAYFELIDYRKIALDQWEIFEDVFALEKSGNKDKRTKWMSSLNEKRNIVSHPSSGVTLTLEQLGELELYERELSSRINAAESDPID